MASWLDFLTWSTGAAPKAGFAPATPVAGVSQPCVLATRPVQTEPCDAEELWISSTDDKSLVQRVSTKLPAIRDTGLTPAQRALLGNDDLLIQIVADRLRVNAGRQNPDKRKVTFDGRSSPSCAHGLHTKIIWKPVGAGATGAPQEWINSCPTPVEVLAGADQGTMNPLGFLQRFWTTSNSFKRVWRVTVDSCGVRSDGKQPNHWLRGRVEVVPNDAFELTWTYVKAKEWASYDSRTPDSQSDSTKKPYQLSQGISLKRNGVELDITRMINSVLSTVSDVQKAFKSFQDNVPKVGFFAKLDISVMEGSLTGSWGNAARLKPDHARIWLAEPQFTITAKLKVFDLTFEAGFGVDWRVAGFFSEKPTLEIVLKISLVLTLEVPWEASYSSARPKTLRSDLSADGTAVVQAVGRAGIMGVVIGASVDVSGGIKFSGAAECGMDRAPFIEGKVEWKKITVTVRAESPWTRPYVNKVCEWPKHAVAPIWEGKLPGDSAAPAAIGKPLP